MANAACGDGNLRVLRWASSLPTFSGSASGDGQQKKVCQFF